jgi:hypothetical protein
MLRKLKHPISLILVLLFAVCVFALRAAVQKDNDKGGVVTVTGCLQKGDEANEFALTATDGKLYDLKSSSVKLAEHVGQKVTVSGKFKPERPEKDEDEAKENKEGGMKEAGDIQVSSLKMVSGSCQ